MSGSWFACSEPERPPDPFVRWHYHDCAACRIKATVAMRSSSLARRVLGNLMGIEVAA